MSINAHESVTPNNIKISSFNAKCFDILISTIDVGLFFCSQTVFIRSEPHLNLISVVPPLSQSICQSISVT